MLNVVLWVTPRSNSTALTYSVGNRSDTVVLDEPLYGSWLVATGEQHQGRDLVINHFKSNNQEEVINMALDGSLDIFEDGKTPTIRWWKMLAKHYLRPPTTDNSWLYRDDVRHVFLVRDPRRIIRSYSKVEPATSAGIGLKNLTHIYEDCKANSKHHVLLLDAKHLTLDPEGVLEGLCNALEISFEREQMLSWSAGPRIFDIPNASFWYQSVWKSTKFLPYRAEDPIKLSEENETLAAELQEIYDTLNVAKNAIRRKVKPAYVGIGRDVHDILPDSRNKNIKIWVSDLGGVVPRDQARVSVFDSSVQNGDHVWEGLRVYEGRIFAMSYHIDRLLDSALALAYQGIPARDEIEHAIIETLKANEMRDGVHMRLTLTRGTKVTSSMNPLFNRFGCNLIVLAEWKDPVYSGDGIRLITSTVRRNTPSILDSKIHHGNMLHLIMAKIQANFAGVDDALMLDIHGFVAETNACNIFAIVRPIGFPNKRILITPLPDACLNGVTRQIVLELARTFEFGVEWSVEERNVSLSEFHAAKEVFVTGTMGALTPVVEIDGRPIGCCDSSLSLAERYPMTHSLQEAYFLRWQDSGIILPF